MTITGQAPAAGDRVLIVGTTSTASTLLAGTGSATIASTVVSDVVSIASVGNSAAGAVRTPATAELTVAVAPESAGVGGATNACRVVTTLR